MAVMDAPDALAEVPRDLSVAAALELLERAGAAAASDDEESVDLPDALGRVLARDLAARADHPNVDDSAMDGFACRSVDTRGADPSRPVRLAVIGEASAGQPFPGRLGAGEAVRIHTGGAIPEGADGVVRLEAAQERDDTVAVREEARRDFVRARGQDVREGDVALRAGRRLDAAAIALAAAMGHPRVPVRPRPKVALLVTGSELVQPGGALQPGEVFDANGPGLSALLAGLDTRPGFRARLGEDRDALRSALEQARAGAPDLIVTSGGISMGGRDAVRDLLLEEGEVLFRRVRVKPGGPTTFGRWRGLPLLALPGNPVSVLVTMLVFGSAYLGRWQRASGPLPYRRRLPARAAEPLRAAPGKETLARVRLEFRDGALWAHSAGGQSSGVVRALADADGLAVLAPGAAPGPGEALEVIPWPPLLAP